MDCWSHVVSVGIEEGAVAKTSKESTRQSHLSLLLECYSWW